MTLPRSTRLTAAAAAVVACLALVAGAALAAPDGRAEARRRYARAMELVDEGAYAEAVVEFTRAYELAPHHTVLYNLGQAYVALGKPVAAIDTLRRYLVEGGAQIASDRRAQVEQELRRQEARVGALTVETDPPGASVQLDGEAVGKTPLPAPLRVGIGVHQVAAAMDGRARAEQSVTVAGEEKKLVRLRLDAAPLLVAAAPPAPPPAALLASPSSSPSPRAPADDGGASPARTLGYVACATGAALGAGALSLYFWNRWRNDNWTQTERDLTNNPNDDHYEQRRVANESLAASIRRVSAVDVGLGIGAGALLATGIILVAASPAGGAGAGGEPAGALVVAPGALAFRGAW